MNGVSRSLALVFVVLLFTVTADGASPSVMDLRDVGPLRAWFQQHTGSVRLILLLSPTCGSCVKNYLEIRKFLEKTSDPRLQVAAVWLPILPQDTRKEAVASSLGIDGRLLHFWDEYRAAGETWQSVLKLPGIAWDVYLVYGPDAKWNVPDMDPAPPTFWMHQLKDVPQAPRLDMAKLESSIREALAAK